MQRQKVVAAVGGSEGLEWASDAEGPQRGSGEARILASKGFKRSAQELEPFPVGIRELSKGSQQGSQTPRLSLPKVRLGCHMVGWGWEGGHP